MSILKSFTAIILKKPLAERLIKGESEAKRLEKEAKQMEEAAESSGQTPKKWVAKEFDDLW